MAGNPDINYVPGETRRIVVPRMSDTDRAMEYATQLEIRDRAERATAEADLQRGEVLKAAARESQRQLQEAEAKRMGDPQAYASGTIDAADQEFGQIFDLAGRRVTSQVPRFGYRENKRYTDQMLGTPEQQGYLDESADLMAQRQAAELHQAVVARDVTAEMGAQQAQLLAQAQARESAEANRIEAARSTVDRAVQLSRKAADDFAKHSEIDPGRHFANAGIGTKIAAALSAAMLGWAGLDPFSHIRSAIQDDIAAQQANIAKRQESARLTSEGVGEARSMYGDLLAQIGDERVARLAHESAVMQGLQTQMATKLKTAGLRTMSAEQQQLYNQFSQQIAENERQIGLLAAGNTPTRTVSRPALNGAQMKLATMAAGAALKDRSTARSAIGEEAAAARKDQREIDAAANEGPSVAERKLASEERKYVTDRTVKRREELRQLQSFREKYSNEIPGFVWGVGWTRPQPGEINPLWGEDEEAAYQEFKRPLMIRLREESGAAIGVREEAKDSAYGGQSSAGMTEDELSKQADEIMGAHNSESALLQEVDRRIAESQHVIDHFERAPEESSVNQTNRSVAGRRAARAAGGVGMTDPVAWEDGE